MAVINFLIIAWVVFLLVKGVNSVKEMTVAEEEEAPKEPEITEKDILLEIRDSLKARPTV